MKFIKVTLRQPVLTITLSRPEVRNAFHPQMIAELTQAFADASRNAHVRVVELRGEGKSFCAGADLEWMKSMAKFLRDENLQDSDQLFEMFQTARVCAKPVIAFVQGHVMGGGVGLTAVCDFVAAEEQTQFCFSEVKLGLVPAVISSFVLEKMNPGRARQAMLTGEVFTAEQALAWGLISFVGNAEACQQEGARVTSHLLAAGPEAVAATKALVQFVQGHAGQPAVRTQSTTVIAERRVSAEGQEGLKSFLEHRKPAWTGVNNP